LSETKLLKPVRCVRCSQAATKLFKINYLSHYSGLLYARHEANRPAVPSTLLGADGTDGLGVPSKSGPLAVRRALLGRSHNAAEGRQLHGLRRFPGEPAPIVRASHAHTRTRGPSLVLRDATGG
jgi:hypothetical protein